MTHEELNQIWLDWLAGEPVSHACVGRLICALDAVWDCAEKWAESVNYLPADTTHADAYAEQLRRILGGKP